MDLPKYDEADLERHSTEQTLRFLFNAIPESMFIMDCQGIVLEANESFAARFGKSLSECPGINVYDLLSPDVALHRRKKVEEVLRTGKRLSFEGELEGDHLLKGRKMHHICPLFGSVGEVDRLVVYSQDITELKRTEESLIAAQTVLDKDLEAMSKLHEISTLFVRKGNVEGIFDKVIDAACAITGSDMGSVRLVDAKSGHLKIAAQKGFTDPFQECCHDSAVGPCVCDRVMRRKEQIMVADITQSTLIWGKKEVEAHLADGVRSLQLTPMVNRSGELLGILSTYFPVVYHPEERVLKLLHLLASQTADIIERAEKEEALQQSNERYRSLFSNTLNAIAYCRMIFEEERPVDFIYEQVNVRFEKVTGLKNVEGKKISEVIPGIHDINPELLKIFGRVAKTGITERFEFYLESLKTWLDISVYSTKSGHFVTVFDVITERKQTENALLESEKKFRSITEQMAEVVFVTDNFGHLTYASSAIEKIFGYTSQEVLGHSFTEYLVEDEISRALAIFNDALLNQLTLQILEFKYQKKNGAVFCGEAHLHYYYDNGSFGIIGLIHDITERKRNEAVIAFRLHLLLLADSYSIEEVLRETLDEAERLTGSTIGFIHFIEPDQISISLQAWSTNTEKKLCRVEDGFRRHYPLKDAGVWADAIRERRAMIHNNYNALPKRKGMPQGHVAVERELVVPIMRGEKITAIIGIGNKAVDYDQEDVKLLSSMVGIAWDIIARKKAELSESRIQNELVKAQKMELVGRLAGGIAHDFNNMLCVILGHAEMALLDNQLNESLRESLQEIFNAAEKSADLTHQLLAFARKQPLIPKVLDLNVVIEGMLNMLRRLIGEDITLVWSPEKLLYPVNMDSSHIDQILINLCVNARDAITEVGKIVIETKNVLLHEPYAVDGEVGSSGAYVLLSVSDNGRGIEEKDAGYIFEPFFTTKESGKGTGLGLSTVYGLVKQNNGFIRFSSEPGKGTEFSVYFPGYTGEAFSSKRELPAEKVKPGEETILIVDDENEILKLSKMILQNQGYHVLTAGTPAQAIQIAQEYKGEINLLLTDIIMPEMNGRDLSGKICSIFPNIKVLFMSGYTADIIASQGGVDEVMNLILKPFSIKGLTNKVYDTLHVSPHPKV